MCDVAGALTSSALFLSFRTLGATMTAKTIRGIDFLFFLCVLVEMKKEYTFLSGYEEIKGS